MTDRRRPRVALTIGKLDGVHLGHRRLLEATHRAARHLDAESAALVLDPHPAVVLSGRRVPVLTPLPERLDRLGELVDRAEVLPFDAALAALAPEAFVAMLAARFELAAVVVGPDFAFGRDRRGDVETLRRLGAAQGFEARVVEPVEMGGTPVSSGRIRAALARGDVGEAAALLGRPPSIRGVVVPGEQRGRALGFPTANLEPIADYALPADGIYAVRAAWRGRGDASEARAGAASLGVRPQFEGAARTIEVHLIDFEGDLYGRELAVAFLAFLRPEARFASVDALVEQIGRDVEDARRIATGAADGAGPSPGQPSSRT